MIAPVRIAALASWIVVGCGGAPGLADGGPPDGQVAPGVTVAAPPSLSACAEGSSVATTPEGLPYCSAPPITECGDGEAWHAGGCVAIGSECPGGDGYPSDLPASGVLYVRAGAAGDGTRERPYGAIADAMAGAVSGTVIALAAGTYDEQLVMRSGVEVRGACASETRLAWSRARGGGSVEAPAGVRGAAITDLTIGPSDNIGVLVRDGSELRVERVLVRDASWMGVAVLEASTLEAAMLVVQGTRPTTDLGLGRGVVVEGGSQLRGRNVVLERNTEVGLSAMGAETLVELDGVTAVDARIGSDVAIGGALLSGGGARIVARNALFERSIAAAVLVLVDGTIELEDAEIRTVDAPAAMGQAGWAMSAVDGSLDAHRVSIRDAQGVAVGAYGSATIRLRDVVILATRSVGGDELAAGLVVAEAAAAEVERLWIEDSSRVSLLVSGPADPSLGEARLTASDVTIVAMRDRAEGAAGLYLQGAARGDVTRARIARASELALGVHDGPSATFTDLWVQDTAPDLDSLHYGRGLEVFAAAVTLSRARFERQSEIAIIVARGTLEASELTIADTRERGCAATSCPGEPAGIGIGAYAGADVRIDGFAIDEARLCGVQVHGGGQLDLRNGRIANATVGACVQSEGYDLARLTDGVVFAGNGVAVQATSYAPPAPRELSFDL